MEKTLIDSLFSYSPIKDDFLIENPYLHEMIALKKQHNNFELSDIYCLREEMISKYAFSIPTIDVLRLITDYSPLIELGAGNGYWAWCLNQLGADIICFDLHPPQEALPWPWGSWEDENIWFDSEWYPVNGGDEKVVQHHGTRTLLLCWPVFHTPMASTTLDFYLLSGGTSLIYIGDNKSCGDVRFHEMLGDKSPVIEKKLPGWPGIDDYVRIFEWKSP